MWASVVVAAGLQSADSRVVAHRLTCSAARGIFLDQGSDPCPVLADGFSTTETPGKPYHRILNIDFLCAIQ